MWNNRGQIIDFGEHHAVTLWPQTQPYNCMFFAQMIYEKRCPATQKAQILKFLELLLWNMHKERWQLFKPEQKTFNMDLTGIN